jgi:basic endochitinase B
LTDRKNDEDFGTDIMLLSEFCFSISGTTAQQCGSQAGGKVCPGGLCCSKFGYRGNTPNYCGTGCQSNCPSGGGTPSTPTPTPSGGGGDIGSLISKAKFDDMLKHRNDGNCPAKGFYTYEAFIQTAKSFGGFGTTGVTELSKLFKINTDSPKANL